MRLVRIEPRGSRSKHQYIHKVQSKDTGKLLRLLFMYMSVHGPPNLGLGHSRVDRLRTKM